MSSVASYFEYHPVCISKLLPEKTEKAFSQILTESRVKRAEMFLRHIELSIGRIAAMPGYSNSSNFYKVFRQYFGSTPRIINRS
ncbi:MAG: helix-turn-helix domain-containing protein [Eubacteriales bacterium]|nr:helix-turn-helix domain-containing protein [Eubacteriales bacterium]